MINFPELEAQNSAEDGAGLLFEAVPTRGDTPSTPYAAEDPLGYPQRGEGAHGEQHETCEQAAQL